MLESITFTTVMPNKASIVSSIYTASIITPTLAILFPFKFSHMFGDLSCKKLINIYLLQ